jgi:hypothetical protein
MYMILGEIKIPNPGKNAFSQGAAFAAHSASIDRCRNQLATLPPVSTSAVAPTLGSAKIRSRHLGD